MLPFFQHYYLNESYILLEVKASKANIAQFKKVYAGPEQEELNMSDEDVSSFIEDFNKELKRGTMKQKDIFAFRSWQTFLRELDKAQQSETKAELKKIEKEGGTRVYEDDNVLIVHPTTHRASCAFGSGSKWCVASKNDPGTFKNYTEDHAVVLLYFLPKGRQSFRAEPATVPKIEVNKYNIHRALMLYPQIFEGYGGSDGKAIGAYILAAYQQGYALNDNNEIVDNKGDVETSIDHLSGLNDDNMRVMEWAIARMSQAMQSWNEFGGELIDKHIAIDERPNDIDVRVAHEAAMEGFLSFIAIQWGNKNGQWSQGVALSPNKFSSTVNMILTPLFRDRQIAAINNQQSMGRLDKMSIAVYSRNIIDDVPDLDAAGQRIDSTDNFGPYVAEGFDAQDSPMNIRKIMGLAGITDKDVDKISEYIKQFSGEKVWRDAETSDKGMSNLITHMEVSGYKDSESVKRADELFIKNPLGPKTWNYAIGRGEYSGDTWDELEQLMLKRLDEIVSKREDIKELSNLNFKDLLVKSAELGGGSDLLPNMKDDFKSHDGEILNNFMRTIVGRSGLYGYYMTVKGFDWPELEKRILDLRYASAGLYKLIPDIVRDKMKGKRWPEGEEILKELFVNSASSTPADPSLGGPAAYWAKQKQANNEWYTGNMDDYGQATIWLIKNYLQWSTGDVSSGSSAGRLRVNRPEFKDAWWYDPEVVGKYWNDALVQVPYEGTDKNPGKTYVFKTVHDNIPNRPFFSKQDLLPVGKMRLTMPSPFMTERGEGLEPKLNKEEQVVYDKWLEKPPSMEPR